MTRIAVLGANGFIGRHLVEALLSRGGDSVCPVVRTPSSYAALSRFALEGRVADAGDCNALRAAFHDCEAVVHAAAGDRRLVVDSIEPVYRAASLAGVQRLVYLSSLAVHGYNPAPETNEESPLVRKHEIDYCNWKVAAEARLQKLRQRGGPEVVILRPGIVWGPRSQWVRDFAKALGEGRAYVIGDGKGVCPSIHVDNLVQAIELAVSRDGVNGEAFIVGDDENVTWQDLYAPIVEVMGQSWAADVHRVGGVPPQSSAARLLQDVRRSSPVQGFRKHLPQRLKNAAFAAIDSLCEKAKEDSPFAAQSVRNIDVTREMTLLQQCENKLSHVKSERRLGYRPKVSFEAGMAGTLAWLDFAGYRPMDGEAWPYGPGAL